MLTGNNVASLTMRIHAFMRKTSEAVTFFLLAECFVE